MKEIRGEIVSFHDREIRRIQIDDEWWYCITDVIEGLTGSIDGGRYMRALRSRDTGLASFLNRHQKSLSITTSQGRARRVNCANRQGLFRILQSVPSPRLEPFKQWLAQMGEERLQEIENPEQAVLRAREYYKQKGYDEEWIDQRVKGIEVREELTDEWSERGVKDGIEYAILTAEISRGTFGIKPGQHKELKQLKKSDNLRDHMSNAELLFTALGELTTTEITRTDDAQGFSEARKAAVEGGDIAGLSRRALEARTGRKVVTDDNFKALGKPRRKEKRIKKDD